MRIRSQLGRGTIVLLRLPIDGSKEETDEATAGNGTTPLPRGYLRGPNLVQARDPFPVQGLRAAG
jgi:hypothetical protein